MYFSYLIIEQKFFPDKANERNARRLNKIYATEAKENASQTKTNKPKSTP